MRAAIKVWWHRLRYTDCAICSGEFRKGSGGGRARTVVCSGECWTRAWMEWWAPMSDTERRWMR